MKKPYKTTAAEFKRFREEAIRWARFFGLLDYEICFFHEARKDERAACFFNEEGRIASLILSKEWSQPPDLMEIEKVAFHEIGEVMLFRLQNLAFHAFDSKHVQERTHEVIRRLENTIFKHRDTLLKKGTQ